MGRAIHIQCQECEEVCEAMPIDHDTFRGLVLDKESMDNMVAVVNCRAIFVLCGKTGHPRLVRLNVPTALYRDA